MDKSAATSGGESPSLRGFRDCFSANEAGRKNRSRLICLLGPTAVGKTAISIELAKALGSEVISGDSMLIYKGFDIGTAKPTLGERQGIAHHLVDILPPEQAYSVSDFCAAAHELIAEINAKGKIPLLCGGTGLYAKALLEGYQFNLTAADDSFRAALAQTADECDAAGGDGRKYLWERLKKSDSSAAASMVNFDRRRLIRAIEVAELGGETISRQRIYAEEVDSSGASQPISAEGVQGNEGNAAALVYDALVIGLNRDRAALYERINRRTALMLEGGLLDEVRFLLASGVRRDAPPMKAIGYREANAYLAGEIGYGEMQAAIARSTRRFAKRQLTWYRKMPYIRWFSLDGAAEGQIVPRLLEEIARYEAGHRNVECGMWNEELMVRNFAKRNFSPSILKAPPGSSLTLLAAPLKGGQDRENFWQIEEKQHLSASRLENLWLKQLVAGGAVQL